MYIFIKIIIYNSPSSLQKSREPTENETEKQNNVSREPVAEGPMKKYEPDNTPYESLLNFAGVGDTPPKKSNRDSPKAESKRKKKKTKTKTTETSARDKTNTNKGNSQEDKP
ncbi:hypothetical protein PMAYCL1PPCAC_04591, partial [Pristionchus mayeri]